MLLVIGSVEEIAILDLGVALLVEGADFDADRAAMMLGEVREAIGVVQDGDQAVFVLDGGVVESLGRAIADALLAFFAKVQDPGVFVALILGQVFDLGEDGGQTHARAEAGGDDEAIDAAPTQPSGLGHGWIESHTAQRMAGMSGKALSAEPIGDAVGDLA